MVKCCGEKRPIKKKRLKKHQKKHKKNHISLIFCRDCKNRGEIIMKNIPIMGDDLVPQDKTIDNKGNFLTTINPKRGSFFPNRGHFPPGVEEGALGEGRGARRMD